MKEQNDEHFTLSSTLVNPRKWGFLGLSSNPVSKKIQVKDTVLSSASGHWYNELIQWDHLSTIQYTFSLSSASTTTNQSSPITRWPHTSFSEHLSPWWCCFCKGLTVFVNQDIVIWWESGPHSSLFLLGSPNTISPQWSRSTIQAKLYPLFTS